MPDRAFFIGSIWMISSLSSCYPPIIPRLSIRHIILFRFRQPRANQRDVLLGCMPRRSSSENVTHPRARSAPCRPPVGVSVILRSRVLAPAKPEAFGAGAFLQSAPVQRPSKGILPSGISRTNMRRSSTQGGRAKSSPESFGLIYPQDISSNITRQPFGRSMPDGPHVSEKGAASATSLSIRKRGPPMAGAFCPFRCPPRSSTRSPAGPTQYGIWLRRDSTNLPTVQVPRNILVHRHAVAAARRRSTFSWKVGCRCNGVGSARRHAR